MSVFAKLSKNDRSKVFSGAEIPGTWVPTGDIMPDGSRRTVTREGWNTFRLVRRLPKGQSIYGSREVWKCDPSMAGNERIAEVSL